MKTARIVCYIYWGLAVAIALSMFLGMDALAKMLLSLSFFIPLLAAVNVVQFAVLLRRQRNVEVFLGFFLGLFMLSVIALFYYINYRLTNSHYGQ